MVESAVKVAERRGRLLLVRKWRSQESARIRRAGPVLSNFWWRGTPAGWLGRQPRRPPLGLGPRPHDSTLTRVAVCQPSPLPPRPRPPGRRLVGRRGCALLRPGSLLPAGRTGHGHAVPGGLGPRRLTLAPPPPASSGPGPKVKVEPGERQAGPKGAWARPLAAARGAPLRSELGKGRPRNGSAGGDHRSQEGNSRMSAAHQGSSEVAIQGGPVILELNFSRVRI
ncbi:arf-GAP with GTPase, ANK repeat and PH domain-containing protein 2-like [Pteropus medius]|uniref:arf-GAP with GTPase, ANK repeat and PH domain-containing protein 2-like n=1 Tax=Pteropus vampyrus TaxID=132908 RepID=UPI00196B3C13|nr:arf-GAP with GTPase, ANK repeat and PH domain-containing protein 2-like [Pteropus giganteus]